MEKVKSIKISMIPDVPALRTYPVKDKAGAIAYATAQHAFQEVEVPWVVSALRDALDGPNLYSTHLFRDGLRGHGADNWLGTSMIFVDFDTRDITPREIIDRLHAYGSNLAYYMDASNSARLPMSSKLSDHMDVPVKVHLFVPLDRVITDVDDYNMIMSWVRSVWPESDPACTDIKRLTFRGNKHIYPIFRHGGPLSVDAIMVDQFRPIPIDARAKIANHKIRSEMAVVHMTDRVETTDGKIMKLEDLRTGDTCMCPVCGHDPNRGNAGQPNAVLMADASGKPFLFCSSCKSRGKGVSGSGVYNFAPEDVNQVLARQQMHAQEEGKFFVFNDLTTGKRMAVIMDDEGQRHIVHATIDTIKDLYRGVKSPKFYPQRRLIFDPTTDDLINDQIVNLWQPTDLIKDNRDKTTTEVPKYISRLILHILGGPGFEDFRDKFFLHLAYVLQHRVKPGVAWLMHGTPGTGKNVMYGHVISRIFGSQYCTITDIEKIGGRFNANLSKSLWVLVNEPQIDFNNSRRNMTLARLKMYISDDVIPIERKGVDEQTVPNFANFLFFSNKDNPVEIEQGDRRFNIAPRQETPLKDVNWLPAGGIAELIKKLHQELPQFVQYLNNLTVAANDVRVLIRDKATTQAIEEASQSDTALFFRAIERGDLGWIIDHYNYNADFPDRNTVPHPQALIAKFAGRKFLFKDEVYDLWVNIVHPEFIGRNKVVFGRAANKYLKHRWESNRTKDNPDRRYEYRLEYPIRDFFNDNNILNFNNTNTNTNTNTNKKEKINNG